MADDYDDTDDDFAEQDEQSAEDESTEDDDILDGLLNDAAADSDDDDEDDEELREPGKRALERIKEQRNRLRTEADELRQQVKSYEDQGKSESQRLQEAAEDAKNRATTAEQNYQKMQAAFDAAPEGATLAQVRAVAKRVSGSNADELADDAEELFELIGSSASARPADEDTKRVSRKPRERLRGGGDPDDEPEEHRPDKLADAIGRH